MVRAPHSKSWNVFLIFNSSKSMPDKTTEWLLGEEISFFTGVEWDMSVETERTLEMEYMGKFETGHLENIYTNEYELI